LQDEFIILDFFVVQVLNSKLGITLHVLVTSAEKYTQKYINITKNT